MFIFLYINTDWQIQLPLCRKDIRIAFCMSILSISTFMSALRQDLLSPVQLRVARGYMDTLYSVNTSRLTPSYTETVSNAERYITVPCSYPGTWFPTQQAAYCCHFSFSSRRLSVRRCAPLLRRQWRRDVCPEQPRVTFAMDECHSSTFSFDSLRFLHANRYSIIASCSSFTALEFFGSPDRQHSITSSGCKLTQYLTGCRVRQCLSLILPLVFVA